MNDKITLKEVLKYERPPLCLCKNIGCWIFGIVSPSKYYLYLMRKNSKVDKWVWKSSFQNLYKLVEKRRANKQQYRTYILMTRKLNMHE